MLCPTRLGGTRRSACSRVARSQYPIRWGFDRPRSAVVRACHALGSLVHLGLAVGVATLLIAGPTCYRHLNRNAERFAQLSAVPSGDLRKSPWFTRLLPVIACHLRGGWSSARPGLGRVRRLGIGGFGDFGALGPGRSASGFVARDDQPKRHEPGRWTCTGRTPLTLLASSLATNGGHSPSPRCSL